MSNIKNNTPSNLLKGSKLYIGELPKSSDPDYRQFYDPIWGYRAMFRQVLDLISLGYNSVTKIITRWSPRNKEELKVYIDFIVDNTNIRPNAIIDKTDKITMIRLISAMSHFENHELPVEHDILQAWNLLDLNNFQ